METLVSFISSLVLLSASVVWGSPVSRNDLGNCTGDWSYTGSTLVQTQGLRQNITCARHFLSRSSCYRVHDTRLETSLTFTNCQGSCNYEVITYSADNCHESNRIENGSRWLAQSSGGVVRLNERKPICSMNMRFRQQFGHVIVNFTLPSLASRTRSGMNTDCWNVCDGTSGDTSFHPLEVTVVGLQRNNYLRFFSQGGCSRRSRIENQFGNWQFYGNESLSDFTRVNTTVRAYRIVRV